MTYHCGITNNELDAIMDREYTALNQEIEDHGFFDSLQLLEAEADSDIDMLQEPVSEAVILPFSSWATSFEQSNYGEAA